MGAFNIFKSMSENTPNNYYYSCYRLPAVTILIEISSNAYPFENLLQYPSHITLTTDFNCLSITTIIIYQHPTKI